ncbi:engulfment and cell motility protein 1-like [Macrobrachium nipponense]|uniref:engulfment and cell motility protein 1-like n=1 Tax=Macrobrachium nipponense TaxID=159736 RepID=UPI0030C7E109
MAPTRDANVVKIAVEMRVMDMRANPYLGEFSLQQPLAAFIVDLCTYWKVDNPGWYSLQYSEPPCHYVTEKNRGRIKDGTVLSLILSAARIAEDILNKVKKGSPDEKKEALDRLVKMSSDITFAHEFISKQGISLLISYMEGQRVDTVLLPNMLSSFLELMDHGIMPWDDLPDTFIAKVVSFINVQSTTDTRTLSSSLSILENIVLNSQTKYGLVEEQVTIPHLLQHISNNKKVEIQQSVLALINALFQKSDVQKKKYWSATLSARQYRTILINNVLIQAETGSVGADMAHQLYVLQQLLLNQYEERMNTSMDPSDQDATDKIKELRRIAFESDGESSKDVTTRRPEYKKEYKKLGFKHDINPAQDFMDTPPGMLALDNMVYFARNHSDQYAKLVLENCYRADSHECPFGRASIELTKLLCEILQIGEVPSEQGQTFYPMFFSHDHAFEELFSICIVLLNKTWKEMKATTEDFSKVLSVVKDQIIRTMNQMPSTLDKFRIKINTLNYTEIAEIWQQERMNIEEQEMQAPPIKELRRQLEPEILELIQQHRLRFLVEGTRFKYARGMKTKDKFRYCRLSPNHKFFHYDDCDEKTVPAIEDLGKKISIVELKGIVTGKDCPHMKDRTGKKGAHNLAFSLILESNNVNETNSLDFIAPGEMVYNYWIDGVHALLRQRMPSVATTRDLEMLLNMEIKLRLLDAEGVTIPQQEPHIPPPPPNYNFCYQLS